MLQVDEFLMLLNILHHLASISNAQVLDLEIVFLGSLWLQDMKIFSPIVRLQKAQDPANKWPRLIFKQPQVTSNVEADKTNPSPNLTHLLFIHLTFLAWFLKLEEQRPLEAGEKLCFEFNWGHLEISRYHFEAGGGFKFWEYSQKCPLPQPIFLNITFSIFPRR